MFNNKKYFLLKMEKIEQVETPNEKTFEKLRELQLLLKKESAMKELCKQKYNIKKN